MFWFKKKKKEEDNTAKQVEPEPTVKQEKPAKVEEDKECDKKQPAKTVATSTKKEEKKTMAKTTEEEKTKKPIYRVLYDKESRLWLIKKDGAKRTIATFVTKEEAMTRVKELSSSNELNFVVHKKDGKFQKK